MPMQRENSGNGTPLEREQHRAKQGRRRQAAGGGAERLIFTLNAATGALISIEKIEPDGTRHDVPLDEAAALAGKGNLREIEAALDEAFEAGISSLLEPTGEDEPQDETDEEAQFRRALLVSIIGQDVRRRLQRRLAQRLALSRTLGH